MTGRRWFWVGAGVTSVAVAGLVVAFLGVGLDRADKAASVVGALAAVVGLILTALGLKSAGDGQRYSLAESVDQLAQAAFGRWQHEAEVREVQDPYPIPVRWQRAREEVTAHWDTICRDAAGVTSRPLALAGHLDEIAHVYRGIPSERLVVLGQAGSGKTILALRFALDMLKDRDPTDPVPVIFSLGSWNPTTTSLNDWLISQLLRDYPGLDASSPGPGWPRTLADEMVASRHILPVLDGFDEIAEGLHHAALKKLNADQRPLLLTSRIDEYEIAVSKVKPLSSAAGIELADLTLTDVAAYLPRTTRKTTCRGTGYAGDIATTKWDPVLKELRDHPNRPVNVRLAAVLTTPLMVTLARTVYSESPGRDPQVLLDKDQFGSPAEIEDHLLDSLIPTVYQYPRDSRSSRYQRRWDPELVQQWLGYLARHLDGLGTPDLEWWQLGNTMRRSSRALMVGLAAGLAFGAIDAIAVASASLALGRSPLSAFLDGLVNGLTNGFAVGLVAVIAYPSLIKMEGGRLEPARFHIRIFGGIRPTRKRFIRKLRFGLVIGLLGGLGLQLSVQIVGLFMHGHAVRLGEALVAVLVYGIALGLLAMLAFGLMVGFEIPIDVRSVVSPADLLKTSRKTALFELILFVLVFGIGGGLTVELLGGGALFLQGRVIGGALLNVLVIGLVGGLGVGLAAVFGLTTWGQWVALSRVWLPLRRRLPWAIIAFLDDAYDRGVLRKAGAVYQFRHARLKDRLSNTSSTQHAEKDATHL